MTEQQTREQYGLWALEEVLDDLRRWRPTERDADGAREWAVTITEAEKVYAYFKTFVFDKFTTVL